MTTTLRIAVASGKGGTGKTTVATSLALSLALGEPRRPASPAPIYLDCDVEGPNAHLFLGPTFERQRPVVALIPDVDPARCTACGRCAEVCQYHAIVMVGRRTLVFPQLCHGCGSCSLVCPEGAISETPHPIGVLESGPALGGPALGGIEFARGVLTVGEPMAAPVINQLKAWALPLAASASEANGRSPQVVILDAPPGTSCPVVATLRGAGYLILVTEPTPFGLHDLRLAVGVAAELGIPAGVVINRAGIGDAAVEAYCAEAGLDILMRIPFERQIAQGIAQGRSLIEIHPEYVPQFRAILSHVLGRVAE